MARGRHLHRLDGREGCVMPFAFHESSILLVQLWIALRNKLERRGRTGH